jgi:protein-S-isoprenylcysteine O-methyltransferase Ste14
MSWWKTVRIDAFVYPIYSGVLLMILGTALASGSVQGLLAFAIALISLHLKSRVEERWMELEFARRYTDYKRRSRALIPGVL